MNSLFSSFFNFFYSILLAPYNLVSVILTTWKIPKTKSRLVIVTRYPTPGKCKTRLIPRLGPEEAAHVQRRMTEHICSIARDLAWDLNEEKLTIEVYYDIDEEIVEGPERMKEWLGSDLEYRRQCKGSLTERLLHVFEDRTKNEFIIIIGKI